MPAISKFKILLLCLFIFPSIYGYAQKKPDPYKSKDWQINYNIGFTQFYGDASNKGYFQKFSGEIAFATGATVRKYFNPVLGLGINLWYSGVKSHKEKSATGMPVNYTLTGTYFDGNANLLIDFNNLFWGPSSRKFSVYGIIGIGYGSWSTQLADSLSGGVLDSGVTIGSTTFKTGGFVVPVGIGANYMINDDWGLNLEMNFRTVLNDDVDVWSDGFKYDQLLYTSVGISYYLGKKTGKNKTKKSPEPTRSNGPITPSVRLYDYRIQPDNQGSNGRDPGVITIEQMDKQVTPDNDRVVYRVQILAKRENLPSISALRNRYNIVGDIYENIQNGIHRYSTGSFSSYQEALTHSYLIKDKGVNDAFVVAYRNNNRINITSEMKKINKAY